MDNGFEGIGESCHKEVKFIKIINQLMSLVKQTYQAKYKQHLFVYTPVTFV